MKFFLIKYQIFFTSLSAAIGYGLWAIFANFEHGAHAWAMAGAVQAIYAFVATMSVSKVAHWIFLKYECGIKGVTMGFLASFVVMLSIPLAVHNFAGTPDVLETILPGLIIGSIYLISYLIGLDWKLRVLPSRENLDK